MTRIIKHKNDFIEYPENWPPYFNSCESPCDMLQGPCVCGAWHFLEEWQIETSEAEEPLEVKTNE